MESRSIMILTVLCMVFLIVGYSAMRPERFVVEPFAFADGSKVCNQKFYFEMEGFLSDQHCDTLRELAIAEGMEDSKVGEDKFELDTDVRNSKQVWFKKDANDVARYIHNKVKSLVEGTSQIQSCFKGISANKNFEDVQVVRYGVKGKYDPHFDGTECGDDVGIKCFENQRLATVLIYLNDDFEGGHTRFPNLGISITPKKGSAVFFWVADQSNKLVYQETLHGGDPVLSGEKWIATQWIRA